MPTRDSNQMMFEYMALMTKKLSQTFQQLNLLCEANLKQLGGSMSKTTKRKSHVFGKQREDDLNSNLVDEQDQELPHFTKKKNHRAIEQAQQAMEQQIVEKRQKKPSIKRTTSKISKKKLQKENEQKEKKKNKTVSHKPKAPTSSFLLFFKEQQQQIAKSYPDYGVVELTRVAAKCWNQLSAQQKQPYQRLFQVERKKYQDEMEKYRKDFPEEVLKKELEKKQKKKKKAKEKRITGSNTKNKEKDGYVPLAWNSEVPQKQPQPLNETIPPIPQPPVPVAVPEQKVKLQAVQPQEHHEISDMLINEEYPQAPLPKKQINDQKQSLQEFQVGNHNVEEEQNSLGQDI